MFQEDDKVQTKPQVNKKGETVGKVITGTVHHVLEDTVYVVVDLSAEDREVMGHSPTLRRMMKENVPTPFHVSEIEHAK